MALAIFDLDETLIAEDSDHHWGQFVSDRKLVDPIEHQRKNDAFYEDYKAGQLDINAYLEFACSVLAQYTMEELEGWRSEFFEERIKPIMLPKANTVLDKHREAGDELLVITSTIEFVTRPIVNALGIETLIAPTPEIKDNRYTGKMTGTPSFGAGKVTRLMEWLEDKPHTLAGSYFYSDSRNDLPLLEKVDHPIAVDPDDTLRARAEEAQWDIISLRS